MNKREEWAVEAEYAGPFRWRVLLRRRPNNPAIDYEGFGPLVVWGSRHRAEHVGHRYARKLNG